MSIACDNSITSLSGVGKSRAEQFARLGVRTLSDLLYLFPRAYEKRGDVRLLSECEIGSTVSVILTVGTSVSSAMIRRGMTLSKLRAFDDSGAVEIVFFNSPFVKQVFTIGATFRFYGTLTLNRGRLQMTSPKYEPYLPSAPLLDFCPVYPLTSGLSSKIVAKTIRQALDGIGSSLADFLPESIRLSMQLPTLSYALENVHFPKNEEALSKSVRRLAFDEMLLFALAVSQSSVQNSKLSAVTVNPCSVRPYLDLLPYELTGAQKRAVNEIYADLTRKKNGITPPMTRILVGDVGCGKTVCAALAIYITVQSGYQCALMAPTEILARQHYNELQDAFSKLGYRCALLLGSTKAKERREIYEKVSTGEIHVLIGTHALLSDKVEFHNLGLVITDEQHRFGVGQRATLKNKSQSTHLLVMSATPIPRTLALSLYGDLDISKIDEMPKGRMRVDTHLVDESYRARLNGFISKTVKEGGQCYIVCPSIEPSEDGGQLYTLSGGGAPVSVGSALKDAVSYSEDLSRRLPDIRIRTLHGKMSAAEKDEIMHAFACGEVDCLVSTTVIEVGVNVPNASLMIVENAERFGLSQLHQLRGRVGRGKRKSYCILVSDSKSDTSLERLETLCRVYDGYEIAKQDLMMRGPGDFFTASGDNFRQSGGFQFHFAKLCDDSSLLESAFSLARGLLESDPELTNSEHLRLAERLHAVASANASTIS